MRPTLRSRHLVLAAPLALLAATGCGESAPSLPVAQAWTVQPYAVGDNRAWQQIPKETGVRVVDASNQPVAGEEIRLVVGSGTGTLSTGTATTDAQGLATFTYTPLSESSAIDVYARETFKIGTVSFVAGARPSVSYEQDDVTVALGCTQGLFARVLRPDGSLWSGETVGFLRTAPGVASFQNVIGATGSTSGMRANLKGEQVGETLLVATHPSGVADTARVSVVAADGTC